MLPADTGRKACPIQSMSAAAADLDGLWGGQAQQPPLEPGANAAVA